MHTTFIAAGYVPVWFLFSFSYSFVLSNFPCDYYVIVYHWMSPCLLYLGVIRCCHLIPCTSVNELICSQLASQCLDAEKRLSRQMKSCHQIYMDYSLKLGTKLWKPKVKTFQLISKSIFIWRFACYSYAEGGKKHTFWFRCCTHWAMWFPVAWMIFKKTYPELNFTMHNDDK